jgi:hypothetical protein
MQAEADARAREYSDKGTKAVGSQLRSGHGRWLAVRSEAVTPASASHRASINATAAISADKLHVAIRAIRRT